MARVIYYSSGTGNSLVVARDTAGKIDGRLTPIPAMMDMQDVPVNGGVLGIVFPAYYTRMPGIVERFIFRLSNLQSAYVFAVATVGGVSGKILDRFSEAIRQRGGSLAAGFVVRMPANYIHDSGALPLFIQKRMFRKWGNRVDEIADYILSGKTGRIETFNPVMTLFFSGSIEKRYLQGALDPDIDRYFHADTACSGCGTCSRVCPVGNIALIDSRPVWQHHCQKRLACIQWCPTEAIQFGDVTQKRRRYRHPDVRIADMLDQNERPAASWSADDPPA